MRKFRVWSKTRQAFIQEYWFEVTKSPINTGLLTWVYQDLVPNITKLDLTGAEVQQQTGLKDKLGKDVYEGDLVKVLWHSQSEHIKEVYYDHGWATFAFGKNDQWNMGDPIEILEVVGNIYEKPELLNEKTI